MDSVVNQCYFAIQCVFDRTRKIKTINFSINWCRLRQQNYSCSRSDWRTIFKRKKLIMKCFNPASNIAVIRYESLQFMKFLPLQYFHVTYSIFETKYLFCLSLLWNFFYFHSAFLHITFYILYVHLTIFSYCLRKYEMKIFGFLEQTNQIWKRLWFLYS